MNNFLLTEKDLAKLSVMILLAATFFGLFGLVVMLSLQWLTRQTYAQDDIEKHGIANTSASRLGGIAVCLISCILLIIASITGLVSSDDGPLGIHAFGWFGCVACAVLGLVEDFRNNILSPRYRLLAKAIIFIITLWLWPALVPDQIGISFVDSFLANSAIGWLLTILFCVGFLNAANMADGANGLMPGILFITFTIFYLQTGGLAYSVLMTTSGLFLIFNVISGRLFLGDAGSYGLGAAVALSGLYLYSNGVFSAAFLATLLMYPCVELLVSMGRRLLEGRSMFLPDNDHLHNRVYFHFQRHLRSKTLANSLTGLTVAMSTSGLALAGYLVNWWPVTDERWIFAFLGQCLVYSIIFVISGFNRSVSQHVVPS
ncbi:MAG: MraY family glycosyltransferase [Porticoccaceae bacterium]|nr:MraY family glycosyltransferase [Porticoccaceae bacterium]